MAPRAAHEKALLFSAGGVRFGLQIAQVHEIVAIEPDQADVVVRGSRVMAISLSVMLGLPAGRTPFAILTEGSPLALKVEALQGMVDLASAEIFQLPARTVLPEAPPFQGAIVTAGVIAFELSLPALGWAPIQPAAEFPGAIPETALATGREIVFKRGGRAFAVPVELLAHVIDGPRVFAVPLAPSAHRGVLYHGRALHPVFDLPVVCGDAPLPLPATALLVDAGGDTIAVLADAIIAHPDAALEVSRPSWDVLFANP